MARKRYGEDDERLIRGLRCVTAVGWMLLALVAAWCFGQTIMEQEVWRNEPCLSEMKSLEKEPAAEEDCCLLR